MDLQNIQTAPSIQYQKSKQPNQRMGRGSQHTFLQRRHTDGQEEHEKMLNDDEVSPHTGQNGHCQKA